MGNIGDGREVMLGRDLGGWTDLGAWKMLAGSFLEHVLAGHDSQIPVREIANLSAARAALPDYVKLQRCD